MDSTIHTHLGGIYSAPPWPRSSRAGGWGREEEGRAGEQAEADAQGERGASEGHCRREWDLFLIFLIITL